MTDRLAEIIGDPAIAYRVREYLLRAGWEAEQGARVDLVRVGAVEDLEALPVGSVVRHWSEERIEFDDGSWEQGAVAEKRLDAAGAPAWFLVGRSLGYRSHQADILPATVIYDPLVEQGTEEPEWEYAWEADEAVRTTTRPRGPRILFDGVVYPPETIALFARGRRIRRRKAGPWAPVEQGDDQTTNHEIGRRE